jgi:hypothetical protein
MQTVYTEVLHKSGPITADSDLARLPSRQAPTVPKAKMFNCYSSCLVHVGRRLCRRTGLSQ